MIKISVNGQNFHFTPEQLKQLNGILKTAVVLKEKTVNGKWTYVPDPEAKPMQLVSETIVEWAEA